MHLHLGSWLDSPPHLRPLSRSAALHSSAAMSGPGPAAVTKAPETIATAYLSCSEDDYYGVTRGLVLQSQRTQKKDFGKGKRSDEWTDYRNRNTTWENIDVKAQEGSLNQEFEDYYKEQNVCPADEWDEFMHTLREPLPIAFRINGSGKFSEQLKERLQKDFFSKFDDGKIVIEGAS